MIITADSIIDDLNIVSPHEIILENIIEHYFDGKIEIIKQPLTSCEAQLTGFEDRAIMHINSKSPLQRQRFSIGHEIAHWLYDRNKGFLECSRESMSPGKNRKENRANKFASQLLMPEKLFKPLLQTKEFSFEAIIELAKIFNTSIIATAIRSIELINVPSILMLYDTNSSQRQWFYPHKDIPKTLFPPKILPLKKIENRPVEVDTEQWFDFPNAESFTLMEDTIKNNYFILKLLIFENDEQLMSIEN